MAKPQVGNVSDELHVLVEQAETASLVRVKARTFTDQRVLLDGSEWISCRFVRCQIAVVLGAFRVDAQCSFEDCRIRYNGPAGRVYDLITANSTQSHHARDRT